MVARRIQTGAAALVLSLSSLFILAPQSAYATAGPTNFTAVYNTSTQQVDLSWDAVAPDGTYTYDRYNKCIKPSVETVWQCSVYDRYGSDMSDSASLSASIAGYYIYPEGSGLATANALVFGSSYDFKITARQNGVSGSITEASTVTNVIFGSVGDVSSASAPRQFTAELYGGTNGIGNDRFFVNWQAPLLVGSSAIVGYSLKVRETGQANWIEIDANKTSTTPGAYIGASTISLSEGKSYDFLIVAINEGVGASSNSAQISKVFNVNTPVSDNSQNGGTGAQGPTTTEISDSQPNESIQVAENETVILKDGGERNQILIDGGTLKGIGRVGILEMTRGKVAPGLSPGILSSGNLSFTGGTVEIEIGGTTAGNAANNYDQINVTGTVNLGTATTLTTILYNNFAPATGQTYTIINNDGTDAVTGTFSGLVQGATFTQNGVTYSISYTGGDGNDVVLTVTGVTATAAAPNTGFAQLVSSPVTALFGTILVAAGVVFARRSYVRK